MTDKEIIFAKAASVRKHLKRIRFKLNTDLDAFLDDIDQQESVLFNLQMAIQNCVDIAAHIVSEEDFGLPGNLGLFIFVCEK